MASGAEEMVPDLPCEIMLECTGRQATVEVVDGTIASGTLIRVDPYLGNVELAAVRCQMPDSSLEVHERFFIPGHRVRLMHLPPEVRNAPQLQWRRDAVLSALKRSFKETRHAPHVPAARPPRTPRPPRAPRPHSHKKESSSSSAKQLRKLR